MRGRAWTYDSAVTRPRAAAAGDLDGAGALLDVFQALQRADGALESSYDLAGKGGAGPLRSGNQAWVGLAALEWRAVTCSGPPRPADRRGRALAARRSGSPIARRPASGWSGAGRTCSWASTEHNLEARAFFAGAGRRLRRRAGRPRHRRACPPGLDGLYEAGAALAATP